MSFAQSLAKTLGESPYSPSFSSEIQWRRQHSSTGVGVDILLRYSGVKEPTQLYPPLDKESLLHLVEAIETGGENRTFQSRALFYTFLDYSQDKDPKSKMTISEYFASQIWMSKPEQALIKAIWFLDNGRPNEALEHLGQPWELNGADQLHDYIVEALAYQKPAAVVQYQATRGISSTHSEQLVKSLALKGKFMEVLDISRSQQNPAFLKEAARAAIENREFSLDLAQLPCTPTEWNVIKEELDQIILNASPSSNENNATTLLARNILMVRALHVGDTETLMAIKGSDETADLFINKFIATA